MTSIGEQGPRAPTFAEVEEIDQEWLWPGMIPAGLLTVLFGPAKASKSTFVCDYAARVSRGDVNPDGTKIYGGGGPVLLAALEDISASSTIFKLKAARADLGNIVDVSKGPDGDGLQLELDHAGWLTEVAKAHEGTPLIIIDTLSTSANKPITTRPGLKAMLRPLAKLAESGPAVLLTAHSLKGNDEVPEGGRSLTSIPRQVLSLQRSKDEPGVRMLTVHCSNITSDESDGFRYRLAMRNEDQAPHIEWSYDTVRVGPGPEATAKNRILLLLGNSQEPVSIRVIAAKTGVDYGTVAVLLNRMKKAGEAVQGEQRGMWTTPREAVAS